MEGLSLEGLLSEALAGQKEKQTAEAARKRAKAGTLRSPAQMAEDERLLAAWESRHVWKDEANVARFRANQCLCCDDYQYLFQGLYRRQSHRHMKDGSRRWIAGEKQDMALPNEVQVEQTTTDFCGECLGKFGFDWGKGYTTEGVELTIVAEADEEEANANE